MSRMIRILNKKTKEDFQKHFKLNSTLDANGCLIYNGHITKEGYGAMKFLGRVTHAHRISAWAFGILDHPNSSILVLHKNFICKSKACINPEHLYVGTDEDNARDSIRIGTFKGAGFFQASKTHCPQGHPYSLENTHFVPNTGRRICRVCDRERSRNESHSRDRERESEKAESAGTEARQAEETRSPL